MPNKNYIAGRAFEYEVVDEWRGKGYAATRTAGSHGSADIIAFRPDRIVELIQCKRVTRESEAKRLIEVFVESTVPSRYYHQTIAVKIKGTKQPITRTI
jgi:Holliday junction resolvase